MEITDFCGDWVFARPGRTGREERPAKAELRDGVLVVAVPRHGRGGMQLEVRLEGDSLQGEYAIGADTDRPTRGSLTLRVLEEGRLLRGHPAGFVNRERWDFRRPA